MKNLKYGGSTYQNIFHQKDNNLIKISETPVEVWEKFCNKNLKYVNKPISFRPITPQDAKKYKVNEYQQSIITLPFLDGYKTLHDTTFNNSFTTTDILQLLKKNMDILQHIHQNQVTHGDVTEHNIMIDKDYNLEFIDFDSATVDDYISQANVFYEEKYSDEEKIKNTIQEDKTDILMIYFTYLCQGNFKNVSEFYHYLKPQNQKYFGMKKQHINAIIDFFNEERANANYYYIDFIDELIKEDYQAPVIYKKNNRHK